MKSIAIVGASSQIAKDLIRFMALDSAYQLLLFVRDTASMDAWLQEVGLAERCSVLVYSQYADNPHDAVLNFVGVGDPARAALMGADILDITSEFDSLILSELKKNPLRRYIYLSSGAVYGDSFSSPVGANSVATYPVNSMAAQNYYAIAKLHAEVRHRSLARLAIIDVRVFNYFSRYQSLNSRFMIADALNSIKTNTVLQTSPDGMSRDFLHPEDFYQLITCLLAAPAQNTVVDCYSAAPIEKFALLDAMSELFGLRYEEIPGLTVAVNATGMKTHYYSTNRKAAEFGYLPRYSSLDTIRLEASALLEANSHGVGL